MRRYQPVLSYEYRRLSTTPRATLREVLAEASFGLALSSGFFGFFAHTGLLAALLDQGLVPSRVSGSSAGALIGGLWAAGLEIVDLRRTLAGLTRDAFWDPAPGLGLLRGRKFRGLLDALLPERTFGRTRVPLAISAYDVLTGRTAVIGDGPIAPAIHASCAVPLMFHPVRIGHRLYVDGGVADRPGLVGMRSERVFYHHLASRWSRGPVAARRNAIPRRPGLFSLVLEGLPRPHPFDLTSGPHAIDEAYARTCDALDRPVGDGNVRG
jgi:NTE family protein